MVGLIALIIYQASGIKYCDGLGSMVMGVIIAIMSIALIWGVKDYLSGKSASTEIEKKIRDAALGVKHVKDVLELSTMYMGTKKLLLHMDIGVNKSTTADEIGEIVDVLKKAIKKEVPIVSTIQIEVMPS